ncbi:efflux RND transporter permease subunit [Teredinibacter turnerae]|uniref:efflux RND transporter permease subunit n=1 Tax=Teredinibacter turnerae TaxID=2426 RepID=UPI0005F7D12C|nr:MMPL family transporter [Teredinibacter turnerae]
MKNIFEQFFAALPGAIWKFRWLVLLCYAVLVAVCFVGAGKVEKDDSLKAWFGKDSDIFKNQRKFDTTFGSNEDVYIVVEAKDGDIFTAESLSALLALHNELAAYGVDIQNNPDTPLRHTREVISLVNVQVTEVEGNNLFVREFIGQSIPVSADKRAELKASALGNPELRLAFISDNAKYAAISIKTDFGETLKAKSEGEQNLAGSDELMLDMAWEVDESSVAAEDAFEEAEKDYDEYYKYMESIRGKVKAAGVDDVFNVYYAGLPEIIYFQMDVLDAEMPVIFSGLFLLIFILLLVVFRHMAGVAWPIVIVVLSVLFTVGFIGWSGVPSSSLSDPMILLIVLISVADAVHLISTFNFQRKEGEAIPLALSNAFRKAGLSCFFTTITTVVGFGSLWIAKPSVPIANFGFFCAVGILCAFFVTTTLLPLMLRCWSPGLPKSNSGNSGVQRDFSAPVFRLVDRHPGKIIAGFAIGCVLFGVGFVHLKVDTNVIEGYKPDSYIRKAFDVADQNMGGTQNIDFMIDLNEDNALYDADVLLRIDEFQRKIESEFPDLVVTGISIADVMKRVNQQLHGDDPAHYAMPETSGEVSQLLFLFNNVSPEERRKLVSDEFDATRIAFMVRNAGSTAYVDLIAESNRWFAETFSPLAQTYPDMELVNAGGVVTFMHLFDRIAHSQLTSFLTTLGMVAIMLLFVFRSFYLSMLALVSSVVPIGLTFGAMGWLGIDLNQFTMIVAPIILGIAVDDSIHLINKLRMCLSKASDMHIAVREALREVIQPLAFTSIVLSGGLLTMMYSSDASFQAFGYLSALAILSAFVADILLIPSICLFVARYRKPVVQTQAVSAQAVSH